ncbi:unnamed protein product [Prunus armeniaca]|uniref:Uncharacterized protein n=1 Tax=Prunus armeniaca TaxID=36596 RepID=A0A6J5Y1C1_PRUAR|nr:unnamed protein product [Prunus armeniaca]
MAVVLKRGRVKRRIFDSIMLRRNPYVWLFETTAAAAPKYGNSECQKMNRRPVALKRGRVKRWIFESIVDKFTGAVPNNSDDFKSCMLWRNPYVWLFETTAAAAPKSGNSECQKVQVAQAAQAAAPSSTLLGIQLMLSIPTEQEFGFYEEGLQRRRQLHSFSGKTRRLPTGPSFVFVRTVGGVSAGCREE